jgi:hypothetical protein
MRSHRHPSSTKQPARLRPMHKAQRMCTAVVMGALLNDEDSATVAAFAERIMPGAPGKSGATDAGVLNYIDLSCGASWAAGPCTQADLRLWG